VGERKKETMYHPGFFAHPSKKKKFLKSFPLKDFPPSLKCLALPLYRAASSDDQTHPHFPTNLTPLS
jgi:hypothetical protein